jgi:hypothetical protein
MSDSGNPEGLAPGFNPYLLWKHTVHVRWPDIPIKDAFPILDEIRQNAAERMITNGQWPLHGLGLDMAEGFPKVLRAGNVVCFEPAVEVNGQMLFVEDTILITAKGHEMDAPGDSFLSRSCVLNGASMASHLDYGQPGISPGEIVTLKGTGLGPIPSSGPVVVDGLSAPRYFEPPPVQAY